MKGWQQKGQMPNLKLTNHSCSSTVKKGCLNLKVMLLSERLYQSYISALIIKEELAATMPPEFAAVDIA